MGAKKRSAQSDSENQIVDRWLQHFNAAGGQDFHRVNKPDEGAEHQRSPAPDAVASDGSVSIGIEVKSLYRDEKAAKRNAAWTQSFQGLEKALAPYIPTDTRYWLRTQEVLKIAGLGEKISTEALASQIAPLLPGVPADDEVHRYQLDGLPLWIELRRRPRLGPGKVLMARVLERPLEEAAFENYVRALLENTNSKFTRTPWATMETFLLLENKEYTLIDLYSVQAVVNSLWLPGAFGRIDHIYFVDRLDEEEPDIYEIQPGTGSHDLVTP
jgi:hypothetical protein